jgi:predicted XRE-type DNA-binding protein
MHKPTRAKRTESSARPRTKVVRSSGNIFADLGLPNAEEHLIKAHIALIIKKNVERQDLSQSAAAVLMGIAQPDVSKLLSGRLGGFSLERLLSLLRALGHDVEIKVKPTKSKNVGRIVLAG